MIRVTSSKARRGAVCLILGGVIAVGLLGALAFGDNVKNNAAASDVGVGGTRTIVLGETTTVDYYIEATGAGGRQGCDAADGSPATVTINTPSGVTATPQTLNFSACGDANTNSKPVTFSASAAGTYSIPEASVSDASGVYNVASTAFKLVVLAPAPSNVPPNLTVDRADVTVNEGALATNSGTWSDADGDPVALSASTGTIIKNADGTWDWSRQTDDGPAESQSVTITADDSHSGGTTQTSFNLNVLNVAPSATFNAPAAVDEGSDINLSLTGASDPSGADTTAGFNYAFDCDNGGGFSAFGATSSRACPTVDNGTRTVGGKIRDKDFGESVYSSGVTIRNVAPTVSALSLSGNNVVACTGGNTVGLSFSFSDPGVADTWTVDINWGDGSPHTVYATSTQGPQSGLSHTYSAGKYTVSVSVTDDDGGAGTNSTAPGAGVSLLYATSGILQPINYTGARSAFKIGSTIPVKIQITDCAGTPVSGLSPQVSLAFLDGSPDGTAVEDFYSTVPDQGTTMRFTGSPDFQYIYNLGTKGQKVGDYKVTVSEPTIAPVSATFSLRK